MSSELPQNHLETVHQFIEGAIEEALAEADLFLTSLEEQIKLGGFTAQAETEIMPSNEPPLFFKDDTFLADQAFSKRN